MSLFARAKVSAPQRQARSYGEFYLNTNQLVPTRPPVTTAGVPVTPYTAIGKVPLMAATSLVADMPSIMDVGVWTEHGGRRRKMPVPSTVLDPEGQGYGLTDLAYKYLACRILRGNVFLRVEDMDSHGRPAVISLLNPDHVQVDRDPKTGIIRFHYNQLEPVYPFGIRQARGNIIHRRSYPMPGHVLGLSVIANHSRMLGLSLAAEQFGADYFADGAHPTAILSTDQPVDEPTARAIKQRFVSAIRGNREPAVLGAGVEYTPIQITPDESQFLETQKFTAAEQCRMVGPGVAEMLGYDTQAAMTYQNVQQRSLHLLVFTVDKWLRDFERFLSDYMVTGTQEVLFDRNDLMRMTADDRWQMYSTQLQTASVTINEIRAEENLPPVPWGDEPYLPSFGSTGTAAAEKEQITAVATGKVPVAGSQGKPAAKKAKKVPNPGPAAPKIGGKTS